jgi:hypothetical protein
MRGLGFPNPFFLDIFSSKGVGFDGNFDIRSFEND